MAILRHIAVVGSNEADMLLMANFLTENMESVNVDVATSVEASIGLIRRAKSSVLIFTEDPDMGLLLRGIVDELRKPDLMVVALVDELLEDEIQRLRSEGASHVLKRSGTNYYDLVEAIISESQNDQFGLEEEKTGLSMNAWLGIVAIVLMILLSLYLLLA